MNFIEVPQGTPQWFAARCGKITASEFVTVCSTVGGLTAQQANFVSLIKNEGLTPKEAASGAGYTAVPKSAIITKALAGERTEDWSDTAKRYGADLAIERISGQPHGEPPKAWVLERGHIMETAARRHYEGRTGSFVTEAGICLTDDGIFGYSTDGLVDDDGLIEIKAPIDSAKIIAMWQTGDTSEYDHQMQGGMWITGRKWCDFIMYVPDLASIGKDLFVKRVFRDDGFIDKMVALLSDFDLGVVAMAEAVLRGPKGDEEIDVDDVVDADFDESAPAPELASATVLELLRESEPAAALNPAAAWPAPATPPSLRLGQIVDRLGFTVTADFLRTLGFAPAAKDRAAQLYHEHEFASICAALIRHIGAIQAKQAA